jgi:hypothetical protein
MRYAILIVTLAVLSGCGDKPEAGWKSIGVGDYGKEYYVKRLERDGDVVRMAISTRPDLKITQYANVDCEKGGFVGGHGMTLTGVRVMHAACYD